MNYEEKYNEILEWARKNKARLNGVPIEEVLPELTESEDERIRKQLIDAIKIGRSNSGISFTEEAASRYIAWLEKHSEEEIRKIRKEEYTNGFNDAAGFGKQKEQKPAEWSDEDEKYLNRVINLWVNDFGEDSDTVKWLKSLRPHWKPSEEQQSGTSTLKAEG